MYKLTVFVPEEALETLKAALFAAGAGHIGNYSHCCWQIKGMGQFIPLAGSQPHLGKHNALTSVAEWRLEMMVAMGKIHQVIDALHQAHPYETPAYDVVATLVI